MQRHLPATVSNDEFIPTSRIIQESTQVIQNSVIRHGNKHTQQQNTYSSKNWSNAPQLNQHLTSYTSGMQSLETNQQVSQPITIVQQPPPQQDTRVTISLPDGQTQTLQLPLSVLQTLMSQQQSSSSVIGNHRSIAPEPDMSDEVPMYVNAKQYSRIIKRREWRAKMESEGRLPKTRSKYLHESRHLHAVKRARAKGGRFGRNEAEDFEIKCNENIGNNQDLNKLLDSSIGSGEPSTSSTNAKIEKSFISSASIK